MVQSFFKQRPVRKFDHKPIYWDPEKERLKNRIEKIRQELEASGELDSSDASDSTLTNNDSNEVSSSNKPDETPRYGEHIRGTFAEGTSHLKRQQDRGVGSYERQRKNVTLLLLIMFLGFIAWFLFFR